MKFKKLKSSKMSEAVANQILGMIEDRTIKTGDKLPTEQELISSFGVSRTALREGMQRLLMINAIEIRPGVGTFICKINKEKYFKTEGLGIIKNKKKLFEIIEFRKIVETGIIDIAIKSANKEDIKKLEECIKKHEKGTVQGIFPAEGDTQFHRVLSQATHNSIIIDFYEDIFSLVLNSIVKLKNYETEYKRSLKYHNKILEAFKKGDKEAAKKNMEAHLSHLTELI